MMETFSPLWFMQAAIIATVIGTHALVIWFHVERCVWERRIKRKYAR